MWHRARNVGTTVNGATKVGPLALSKELANTAISDTCAVFATHVTASDEHNRSTDLNLRARANALPPDGVCSGEPEGMAYKGEVALEIEVEKLYSNGRAYFLRRQGMKVYDPGQDNAYVSCTLCMRAQSPSVMPVHKLRLVKIDYLGHVSTVSRSQHCLTELGLLIVLASARGEISRRPAHVLEFLLWEKCALMQVGRYLGSGRIDFNAVDTSEDESDSGSEGCSDTDDEGDTDDASLDDKFCDHTANLSRASPEVSSCVLSDPGAAHTEIATAMGPIEKIGDDASAPMGHASTVTVRIVAEEHEVDGVLYLLDPSNSKVLERW